MKISAALRATAAFALPCALGLNGGAAGASDFYAGKTINFIVGADAAGGYDVYARVIARHLSRFIPGAPAVVVENMPGAGSAKAAAYLYSLAPRDGTTIAALFPGAIIDPLLQRGAAGRFDANKLLYLASASSEPRVCVTGPSSKITSFAQTMTKRTVIGATQSGGATSDYAYMTRNATAAQLDIVSGYKGTAAIILAVERGEAEGLCGIDWSSLKTERPQWVHEGTAHILLQAAPEPNAELDALHVPNLLSFVKSDLDRKAVALVTSQQIFSRPYAAPPGVPAAQAKILRQAFAAVLRDPKFLADAATTRLDIAPTSGERLQRVVAQLYGAPADVVQRARQLITSPDVRR